MGAAWDRRNLRRCAELLRVDIGVLKRLNARELWPHEARNFTVWLSDPTRLDDLGNALKLTLRFVGREVPVGRFSVDLLAHDVDRDRPVVIENQLGPTDHDHLGKIITYSAGLDAGVVIWISPDFCEEHRAAIDWLNNHTDEALQFFGVTLEVLQIDDSRPAVNFKVLAFPNGWQKAVAAGYGDAERGDNPQYFQFFEQMLLDLREHGWPSRMRTSSRNYQIIERTFGNIQFSVAFSRRIITAECVIENDAEFNKRLFRLLQSEAGEIQAKLPSALTWDYQDEGRKRQSLYLSSEFDRDDPEALDNARRWAVNNILALKAAIQPRLNELVPPLQRELLGSDGR
jgi:hypothetical protein